MSISSLICWILAKMILAVDPPHIGNGIFDPLVPSSKSSEGYLSNDMVVPILRTLNPQVELRSYDGYNFNHNRCIQFHNRVLCGYDTNKGTRLDDYTMLDIGNGCRARGDRIECGYENPQHIKNLRYPEPTHANNNGDNHYYEMNQHHDGIQHHDGNQHHYENQHHDGNQYHEENYPYDGSHRHVDSYPHVENRFHVLGNSHNEENHHHEGNHPRQGIHHNEEKPLHDVNHHHKQNHSREVNHHHEENHTHVVNHHHEENHHHGDNLPHQGIHHREENHPHDVNHHREANNHHVSNHHPEENHHHKGNHVYKLQAYQVKQTPTRTAMPTNPTTLPVIFNRIKTDYLEKKLLKSAFNRLPKSKVQKIKSVKMTTEPTPSSTVPVEVTSTESTMHQSTQTSKNLDMSTTDTTTLVAKSSESNDISSGDKAENRIVRLVPVDKQKRRQLGKTYSTLPKLVRKSIAESTIASPIGSDCDNKNSDAALRMKASKGDKVTTACVEQDDRVVCYDFKT